MNTPMRSKTRPSDLVNSVAAFCLFLSPWILGFSAEWPAAAWNAWLTAILLAVYALGASRSSGEWAAWAKGGEGTIGLWAICSPWIMHFSTNQPAMWSHVVVGAVVVVATTIGQIWPRWHGTRTA
jgi:hypothetical protein